jgi:hypothetical protein
MIMRAPTLALALLALGCGTAKLGTHQQGIIDGTAVGDDEFPTVGALTTNIGSICTGTLIAPSVVLTAAHCVEPELLKLSAQQGGGQVPSEITYQFTFARDLRAATAGDFLAVAAVEWHERFLADLDDLLNPGMGQWDDIAIMHLAKPVTDRPVQQLATRSVVEAIDGATLSAVAGYGMTDDADPMSAGVLHAGESGLDELGDHELLAGVDDAQQACRGDSGGPMFADGGTSYQIGVASRINAGPGLPSGGQPPPCEGGLLYTRLDSYLPWLDAKLGGLPDDDDDGGDGDGDGDSDDGGGCAATGRGGASGAAFALGLALVLRRRRRAA